MKHKVLIAVPRLNRQGGVSNYYRVLRRYLGPEKEYFEIGAKSEDEGVFSTCLRMILDYWRFHRRLSVGEFQLVHLNPSLVSKSVVREAIFILIARAHSIPILVFFRGWDSSLLLTISQKFRFFFLKTYGRVTGFIVLADDFSQELRTVGIRVPIHKLTTLVDDEVFNLYRVEEVRKERIVILFMSRLVPKKGLIETVDAYSILKKKYPNVSLMIAGEGTERVRVQEIVQARKLDDVIFLGHIDGARKQRALIESDIFVFPTSYGEGMPNTVLEAMAVGLPVITRRVGGLKDFFEHGRMGFMTDSTKPQDFAELMAVLVAEPQYRKQIGAYNRQYAMNNFAASKVGARLEAIYTDTAMDHGSP